MCENDAEILQAIADLKQCMSEKDALEHSSYISTENAKNIAKILFILNGNGHPEEGMVFKLTQVYKWMDTHTQEHDKMSNEQEEKKRTQKDRMENVLRDIIKWMLPFIIYGLAQWLIENVHL